jgi:hypothetical protein
MKRNELFLIFVLALSGCTHYYYTPNAQNVPMFREKNQLLLSAGLGGSESECLELQAAYSPVQNLAVMANYMASTIQYNSTGDYGNQAYIEGALGYYKPINSFAVFEIYAGWGSGSEHHRYVESTTYDYNGNTYYSSEGTSDLTFKKIFIQPSVGFSFDFLDIAFSSRLYRLNFDNIQNYISGNSYDSNTLKSLMMYNQHYFVEPALTFRGGWQNVKLQLQVSTTQLLQNESRAFMYESLHMSLGVCLKLNTNKLRK